MIGGAIIAAVGAHGRDRLPAMALALILLAAPLSAQPPLPPDLLTEFTSAVAARFAPGDSATLVSADPELDDVQARLRSTLIARGVTIRRDAAATVVRVTCFQNLRERGCAADVEKNGVHEPVVATRPVERSALSLPVLSIDVQPIIGQRAPILDAAVVGDRLFVLSPDGVTLYRQQAAGWDRATSQPIPVTRPWPRDLRGRLRILAGEATVVALLPGASCRSTLDLPRLTCSDDREPWPLDIPNAGLDGLRNHFTTPEGTPFFNAAALGTGAGAAWLAAAPAGELVFLDDQRRTVAATASGDDVVALDARCAGESLVLVASPRGEDADTIRAFRVSERRLIPRAAPVDWRGQVTALWSDAAHALATAVVRSEGGRRYDAYHIRLVCDR